MANKDNIRYVYPNNISEIKDIRITSHYILYIILILQNIK